MALACTVSLIADLPLWNQVLTISNWLAISLMIIAALFGLTSFIYYRIKDKQILAEQAHNQFFNCEQSDDEQKLTMSYNLFSRFRGVTVRTAIVFVVGFSLILVTYGLSYFTYLLTQYNDTTLGPLLYGLFLYIQGSFIAILLNMGIQLLIESIAEWN
ncbi:MAG TPA: hypothetical protein VLG71_03380 [Candidatus Limnocylindria bacterium]|nr:hypothetical protein [Candidatus Limnocylindria bacterium]